MISVAILGSGPSALVAAHAVRKYGNTHAMIYSIGNKSSIWGAQYLHQPIPGISHDQPQVIRYKMTGKPEEYLTKVYGDLWDGHVSDDLRDQAHCAWDLRAAYDQLWDEFMRREAVHLHMRFVDKRSVNQQNISTLLQHHDIVVNTVPRPVFCMRPKFHQFRSTEIWAMGDSDRGRVPVPTREGEINYNGSADASWYRSSRVFGYSTVEWPQGLTQPPIPGVARVKKPINHNCDCMPAVKHLGRMGRWDKSVLVHNVYASMMELLMAYEEKM